VTLYYPAEAFSTLSMQAQSSVTAIAASTTIFRYIVTTMFVVSYVWLGVLGGLIIKTLKPEFTTVKCIAFSAVSVAVTLLALWLLIGVV